MRFSFAVLPEKRTIVVRYTGVFTLASLVQTARAMWNDPAYTADFDGLIDLGDASASVALEDFRAFLQFIRSEPKLSRGRWAIVTDTPFATACSLLYRAALGDRQLVEVFSTWEAACEFLDVAVQRDIPLPLTTDFSTN